MLNLFQALIHDCVKFLNYGAFDEDKISELIGIVK